MPVRVAVEQEAPTLTRRERVCDRQVGGPCWHSHKGSGPACDVEGLQDLCGPSLPSRAVRAGGAL